MDHNHCWCAYRNRLDDPLYAREHGNTASGRFASYAGSRGGYSCIPNKGAVASLGERLAQQATSCGQQLSLAVSRTKQIAPFSRDAQDGHYARCYPCRPTRRHAVAVGDLRALPASCTYGPCTVDHPLGRRCVERHVAPLGSMHGMRRQGRNHPNPGLGWTTDAGARMADGRHLRAANLCFPAPFPLASEPGLDHVGDGGALAIYLVIGDQVVQHPNDRISDGVRVANRENR